MTETHIAVMKEVVQIRAQQLISEDVGYLKAITQITKEIYLQLEKGKDTRIGDILPPSAGNAANAGFAGTSGTSASRIRWDKVPWKDLARALDEAVKSVLKRRTQNKAKLEAIRDRVTPCQCLECCGFGFSAVLRASMVR